MRRHAMASSAGPISSTGGFGALWRIASVCALVTTALLASSASAVAAECPNEQLRRENNSLNLPDCRAYEMVSPLEKNGNDIIGAYRNAFTTGTLSATNGEAVIYSSVGAFADAPQGIGFEPYLGVRGPSGWSSTGVLPPVQPTPSVLFTRNTNFLGASADLSKVAIRNIDPPLTPEAPAHTLNLYVRDMADGRYSLLTPTGPTQHGEFDPEVYGYAPYYAGGSADFSHVLFESSWPMTPEAPADGEEKLYEWENGNIRLVGIRPNGEPAPGSVAGPLNPTYGAGAANFNYTQSAISDDGRRIFWSDLADDQLYLRENGSLTVQVSASQRGTPDPAGTQPATFRSATPSGEHVYFTSAEKLTDDATATTEGAQVGEDLYDYNTETHVLRDLSVDPNPGESARVRGFIGASADGSYVYFTARGSLGPGAVTDAQHINVYVWHNGSLTFVAPLGLFSSEETNDEINPTQGGGPKTSAVTPDGKTLVLYTTQQLTSYDNAEHYELYRYDAETGKTVCASCDPGEAHATADALEYPPSNAGALTAPFVTRILSDDGSRIFFDTPEALQPNDTNGKIDVYEWQGGHAYLLSSGNSTDDSWFADASTTGHDVFIVTRAGLVGRDTDENMDLYDVRIDGGFPEPDRRPPPPCAGEDCQGQPPVPPGEVAAGSHGLTGAGNRNPSAARKRSATQRRARLAKRQKLSKELKACREDRSRQRKKCEARARKHYGKKGSKSRRSK